MNPWTTGYIVGVTHWSATHFSLQIAAAVAPFIAGQFTKLALFINGKRTQRAYSYLSPPGASSLELYFVAASHGVLSPHLQSLKVGSPIEIAREASGHFILANVPSAEALWLLSTGTAIGPYLSILQAREGTERFKRIILVHAVRYKDDLHYQPLLAHLQSEYGPQLTIIKIVSRETLPGILTGRIPELVRTQQLQKLTQCQFDASKSQVMLCGNPEMVRETRHCLETLYGMQRITSKQAGQISTEQYW